jgi:hypothetical protein
VDNDTKNRIADPEIQRQKLKFLKKNLKTLILEQIK